MASSPAAPVPILQLRGVSKRFAGIVALDGVDFALYPGEVHALCGENGAGKSTLIKLLSGLHPAGSFSGEYEAHGAPANFVTLRDAARAGIAVIYQELVLVESMSVAENLFLGREPAGGPLGLFIDTARLHAEAQQVLLRLGLKLDPRRVVSTLGVGEKQLLEIAKAIDQTSGTAGQRPRPGSQVLILDEPTAALSEREIAILLDLLRALRAQGVALIYISHKLDEVFALADRVTVLRDGKSVLCAARAQTSPAEVIRHMVGRELADLYPRRPPPRAADAPLLAPLLQVRGLTVAPRPGAPPRLRELSFAVRPGEVVGVYGLMGAGRSELLLHLFGAWGTRCSGEVELGGQPLPAPGSPEASLRRGLALVAEERRRQGLVMDASIQFNLSLASLRTLCRRGLVDGEKETQRNRTVAARLRIKAASLLAPVRGLSGGNQQKVVLGRALLTAPKVVLLDEPTRGIDVGAKLEIYELIAELSATGLGVLLVSSELPELLGLSDRVLVLGGGRLRGEFPRHAATPEALLRAALPSSDREVSS
jgi:D-xylose transport system ATP-binding protein